MSWERAALTPLCKWCMSDRYCFVTLRCPRCNDPIDQRRTSCTMRPLRVIELVRGWGDITGSSVAHQIIPRLIGEAVAGAVICGITRDRVLRFARTLVDQVYQDSERVGLMSYVTIVDQVYQVLSPEKLEKLQALLRSER